LGDVLDVLIPDEVLVAYPYLGDKKGRFRLSDLIELSGLPPSTCHKVLSRMAEYEIVTKQSKASRVWIKRYDTISEWIKKQFLTDVMEKEKEGESLIKKPQVEEKPL